MSTTVAQLVTQIGQLDDLTQLFVALGYEPHDAPFGDTAKTVARWRAFRVVAARAESADSVRALAKQLAHRGERGIAVALAPTRLGLAAPYARRARAFRVFSLSRTEPLPADLDLLEALRPDPRSNALAHALRVSDVLSTLAAGDRFFAAFRDTTKAMAGTLPTGTEGERRTLALLTLTRVLFLYFVQAKGWLAGDRRFLARHLDHALLENQPYHCTVLDPLFFGTLNTPRDRRSTARFSDIPYLNGGLFERHQLERRLGSCHWSNAVWRDVFDGVFERFRFCVREADEVDAIAPDMLGRVFERLMEADQRLGSGTFYTPEAVVEQMVHTAIDTALHVGSTARNGNHGDARKRHRLKHITILDPACGSGAFLMGALNDLTQRWLAVTEGDAALERTVLRRAILSRNLFGVDVNPMAVRLAELRLWLALVADDPEVDPAAISPLPNLDGVIRQGNTLLDPVAAARDLTAGWQLSTNTSQQIERLRSGLFNARGSHHRSALRDLRKKETVLAQSLVEQGLASCQSQLEELGVLAAGSDLFGRPTGLTAPQRQRYDSLTETARDLATAREAMTCGELPFFAFEVHVPDIMRRGGFDVVLGNPPWVRAERLSPRVRTTLRRRFRWWRTAGGRGFTHLPDLALAFIERAVELTRRDGVVALLMPAKLATAGYAESARRMLVRETTIEHLHRVPDDQARAFGATTYPLAIVARVAPPDDGHQVRLQFDETAALRQSNLRRGGPWLLVPDKVAAAIAEFLDSGDPLSQLAPPALGVKTGADRLFIGRLIESDSSRSIVMAAGTRIDLEPDILRPILRGRDVRAFSVHARHAIIWNYDRAGRLRNELPQGARWYFEHHRERLVARCDYRGGAIWQLFRTRAASSPHRVIWADIGRRPRAVYLEASNTPDAIPLNTCYCAPLPSRTMALAVTAVLNSRLTRAYVMACADEARGGYRRMNARVMSRVPVPGDAARRNRLAILSELAHEKAHVDQDTLDDAVVEALELPHETARQLRQFAKTVRR